MTAETDAACAEALNKLADYFDQNAVSLEPWRKNAMRGPKIVGAEIATWHEAAKITRAYASRKSEGAV